ncbi:glycoside hydrolase family 5 protein [Methylobacterium mesophilicum SR1.6/6]|uniref:Glycoside hydrolase family 5 protein n=1 Tax=Methylobacterium mesophilicum SR1.6/6 TaxID=908290 RepID=A0A6B9FKY1_9HYPH|nr:cellulase family glycosylhydrolase [Methylobacterium mesophilicum]QGY02672.1 glycoside hydrolase family 5 protein [Methylobacterium mesophilicum SR1.6/6]
MVRASRRALLAGSVAAAGAHGLPARAAEPLSLRRGIALWPWFSLTTEYPAPRTEYAWPPFQSDRPTPTDSDLRRLAALGFDFTRLPLDPGPFVAFTGARRTELLASLSAAIDAVLATGMRVLVNVQANAATHHYTPDAFYGSDRAPLFPLYRDLVAELARLCARKGLDRVALEPVNEPPQACGADAWNRVQAALLTAARAAAPSLTLVATGSCGSLVAGLTALDPAALARYAPLLYTFHFYEPYLFSHQGAPWLTEEPFYRWLNAVPWPGPRGTLAETLAAVQARIDSDQTVSSAEKIRDRAVIEGKLREYFEARPGPDYLAAAMAPVSTWADLYGIAPRHVLIGEFGALRTDARYTAARSIDRAAYIRDVREAAERAGFAWSFWNLFDGLGLMDEAHIPDPALVAALGLRARP